MTRLIALVAAVVLAVAACGSGDAEPAELADVGSVPTTENPITGGETPLADDAGGTMLQGMGPGISVEEMLAGDADGPLLVNGYVFVGADGSIVIADAIAESYPPQPAGAQASVTGVDLMQLPLVEGPVDSEIATASWTVLPVQLVGDLVDGVFVGNSVASA